MKSIRIRRTVSAFLSVILILAFMLPANAAAAGATTQPTQATSAFTDDEVNAACTNLVTMASRFGDTYRLEELVQNLQTHNTFSEKSYLTFKAVELGIPESVYDQLDVADQQKVKTMSTYQALVYVKGLDEYRNNQTFRDLVDKIYDVYTGMLPSGVRNSMRFFVPRETTELLNPDQLCLLGGMIVGTEEYQNLKIALTPLMSYYSPEQIKEHFAPGEIVLMHAEVMHALQLIWPAGNIPGLDLPHTTDASKDNGPTIRPSSASGE